MARVLLFSANVEQWFVGLAGFAHGGAMLIGPTGDIAIFRGDVTPEAARAAHANRRAISSSDAPSSFACDGGGSVHLVPVTDGWILAVQVRDRLDVRRLATLEGEPGEWAEGAKERTISMGLRVLMRCARDDLTLWLAYALLPHAGGESSGQGGAPAAVFVERSRKLRN